jgi:acetyl esterase/lipase
MMIKKTKNVLMMSAFTVLIGCVGATAQTVGQNGPMITQDGSVDVPGFNLQPSDFMSPEAVEMLKARAGKLWNQSPPNLSVEDQRRGLERGLAPEVAAMAKRYPVNVKSQQIAGVKTRIVTPKDGEADPHRVLIELHGGGFMLCADACALLESIPIAAVGRFKVVSVDYRQWPESAYPAATEDVAAVYKDLLKTYRPEDIGIYGCSAGGILAGEAEAWFQDKHLPNPGVLGMFGASGILSRNGDSPYVAPYLGEGRPLPPGKLYYQLPYFGSAKLDSPLISPAAQMDVLARFPPTLLITGTRAHELSGAVYTHTALAKAGVKGDLIVGEGMGHCYIYYSNLPEARDTYGIIVRFFNENLGRH